jgi:ubiquinone/menaquinone biosynthesis C-methylase UbiE
VNRRHRHPVAARLYAREVGHIDTLGAAAHRRRVLDGVAGHVVEIGAGTGISFNDYLPGAVADLVAVEPEPYLRERAELAATAALIPVSVIDATAERLPFGDATFDVAVAARVLCSVQDLATGLNELHRVLRPGGELRFYEHLASTEPRLARWQRALDLVWPRIAGACHASRDTARAIADAGFTNPPSRPAAPVEADVL